MSYNKYTEKDILGLNEINTNLKKLLTASGFQAFDDHSLRAADSGKDSMTAFCRLKKIDLGSRITAENDSGGLKVFIETDLTYELRLMGRAEGFGDKAELEDKCRTFYASVLSLTPARYKLLGLQLGDVSHDKLLNRLKKEVSLTLRVLVSDEEAT